MTNIKKGLALASLLTLIINLTPPHVAASQAYIRLGGIDRYETTAKVSQDGWSKSDYIILVSGENFPDAISAAPLAKKYNAPILITKADKLNSSIYNEIKRLSPKNAVIIGGTGAISEDIEESLTYLGLTTERIGGQDRYETSVKVAEKVGTINGVVLASGENFPDALSIAVPAAVKQMPILLSRANELSDSTTKFLNNRSISKYYIVGGSSVISNNLVENFSNVKRLSGTDRYDTNLAVINEFLGDLNFDNIYLASGRNFPDALSGSADAAKDSSPIILTNESEIRAKKLIRSKEDSISQIKILGGTGVISDLLTKSIFNPDVSVLGYTTYYYEGDKSSYNSLVMSTGLVDEIATDTYITDALGNIKGYPPTSQLNYAISNNIGTYAMISNSFDGKITKTILESQENRQRLINNMLSALKQNNYKGINVDLEGIYPSNRNQFTGFMAELYNKLHSEGFAVTIAVPAKTWDNPKDSWNGAYDYKQIANYSDKIILMTYDEHWSGGTAGPVASIEWVEKVAKYATTVIPKEKLVLGLAAYGYDWSSGGTKGDAYSLGEVYSVASKYGAEIKWDSTYKSPYFNYTDGSGAYHTVWFENGASISYKLDLVNNYQLNGISIWRLGLENSEYWNAIKTKLNR